MKIPIVFLSLVGIFSVGNVVHAHGQIQDVHTNGLSSGIWIFVGALLAMTIVAIIIFILNKKK